MINYGHGVVLSPIERESLKKIWLWRNNYAIWAWCRQNDLINWEEHEKWFDQVSLDKSTRMYMIWASGKSVGVCGLTSIDKMNRRAEFSLYIGTEHQRRGYAKQALYTLFEHGFKNLGLNVIWGETFDGNPAAGLFEAIGMKLEGTRREFYWKNGKFIDCHIYSILSSEWDSRIPVRKARKQATKLESVKRPRPVEFVSGSISEG